MNSKMTSDAGYNSAWVNLSAGTVSCYESHLSTSIIASSVEIERVEVEFSNSTQIKLGLCGHDAFGRDKTVTLLLTGEDLVREFCAQVGYAEVDQHAV